MVNPWLILLQLKKKVITLKQLRLIAVILLLAFDWNQALVLAGLSSNNEDDIVWGRTRNELKQTSMILSADLQKTNKNNFLWGQCLQMSKPNFRTFRALYIDRMILKIWAFKTLPSWPSQTTIRAQEICYNWHWKRNKNGNYLSNGLYFMLINLNGLATMYIWPSHLLKYFTTILQFRVTTQ